MAHPSTSIDPPTLHHHLLRPPVLSILRASGFTRTRPAVLDTVIDLTHRYLTLLTTHTALHAQARSSSSHETGEAEITVTDIRKALMDVGALHPQLSELEEEERGEEDMRGVEAFLEWARGDVNGEIRRVAGMSALSSAGGATGAAGDATRGAGVDAPVTAGTKRRLSAATAAAAAATTAAAAAAAEAETVLATEGREDYLTQLKKKHSKTGEESRWQGTVLGKDAGSREVVIEGWEVGDLQGWGERLVKMRRMDGALVEGAEAQGEEERRSGSSSPLSEMSGSGLDSGFG